LFCIVVSDALKASKIDLLSHIIVYVTRHETQWIDSYNAVVVLKSDMGWNDSLLNCANHHYHHFIAFCQVFFLAPFSLFWLSVLLSFILFLFGFLSPFVFPYFLLLFCTFFFAHVVSSLAYPNLLGNKRLGCCCCQYHPFEFSCPNINLVLTFLTFHYFCLVKVIISQFIWLDYITRSQTTMLICSTK
jgi:hypothetical protein